MREGAGAKVLSLAGRREVKGGLSPCSDLWMTRALVEVVTAGPDADYLGVGSTPFVGDWAGSSLSVPVAPTPDQSHRYLFRLCSISVPARRRAVLRGLRTLVTIRQSYTLDSGVAYPVEREVVSPLWHFQDGNVSWHLKWMRTSETRRHFYDAGQGPGTSPTDWGGDSALLYVPPYNPFTLVPLPYTPLNAGVPPGTSVDFLGTWRDMRYPWTNTDWRLGVPIVGPGTVTLYATVHQTNPETRVAIPEFVSLEGLRVEDQFLVNNTSAVYGRIAGAMLVELWPDCEEPR
jgi:hypothetical protein